MYVCMEILRVASGFRTVSYEAIGVISGITPPDVIAIELKRIYNGVKTICRILTTEERREETRKSLDVWQIRWNTEANGRWTHRLIKNVQS